ncbi:MAG: helix-turn-helix domain-containing protein [Phycisphaerales bacterium]|nr:MAG: helix-turn-helix domain-containing protein [Phycisphaerales bacterium]
MQSSTARKADNGISAAEGNRLLKAAEVADVLRIGVRTVWKLRAAGKLPSVSILGATRFPAADVARIAREGVS